MSKKKPSKKKSVALIVAGPVRHLPPSDKVWNRGATFAGWELDQISALADAHRYTGLGRKVRHILSTKKI